MFNGTLTNSQSGWRRLDPASGSVLGFDLDGIDPDSVGSGSVSQTVQVQPGASYRLSAQVLGDAVVGVTVDGVDSSVTAPGDDWAEVTLELETGTAEQIEVFARTEGATARFDNIAMTKTGGGAPGTSEPVDPNTVFDFSIWEVEGQPPVARDGSLVFDSLAERVVTPNGNGYRHEVKVTDSARVSLAGQYERFSATIEVNLSPGSETIAAQHHPKATGTLSALYIRDGAHPEWVDLENGEAYDGVFDVVVAIRKPGAISTKEGGPPPTQTWGGSYDEEVVVLGTVRSGESFDYEVINDHGTLIMRGLGRTATVEAADSSASYLKFGNYLQARDGRTNEREYDKSRWDAFYDEAEITESRLVFRNVVYSRVVD